MEQVVLGWSHTLMAAKIFTKTDKKAFSEITKSSQFLRFFFEAKKLPQKI